MCGLGSTGIGKGGNDDADLTGDGGKCGAEDVRDGHADVVGDVCILRPQGSGQKNENDRGKGEGKDRKDLILAAHKGVCALADEAGDLDDGFVLGALFLHPQVEIGRKSKA